MQTTKLVRHLTVVLGVAVAVAVSLTACASGSGGDASGSGAPGEPLEVKIATGPPGTYYSPLYVAEAQGFFEEEGVNVEIENLSSTAVSELVAGRADLVAYGAGASFSTVNEGKDVKLVFALASYLQPGFMFALPDVGEPGDCTKIVTYAAGGISHTLALTYNDAFGANAEVVPMTDQGAIFGTITSGQADCYVGPYLPPNVVDQADLRLLIDVRDPSQLPPDLPSSGAGTSLWGVADAMDSNRDAITRTLAAVSKACGVIADSTPKEIAAMLKSTPHFDGIEESAIETTAGVDGEMACPDDGYFPEDGFEALMQFYATASPFIDPSDPTWSWAERVDESYRSDK